jgi:hypothetical protein
MIEPKALDLPNYGVLECDLDKEMIDYLWNLVHSYSPNVKWDGRRLIEFEDTDQKQFLLNDDDHLFENEVLRPCVQSYFTNYGCPFKHKTTHLHELAFSRFWCRASTDGDYQSIHDHQGIFTFVVWLSIPFEGADERKVQAGFRPEASFSFVIGHMYQDKLTQSHLLLGETQPVLFFRLHLQTEYLTILQK